MQRLKNKIRKKKIEMKKGRFVKVVMFDERKDRAMGRRSEDNRVESKV